MCLNVHELIVELFDLLDDVYCLDHIFLHHVVKLIVDDGQQVLLDDLKLLAHLIVLYFHFVVLLPHRLALNQVLALLVSLLDRLPQLFKRVEVVHCILDFFGGLFSSHLHLLRLVLAEQLAHGNGRQLCEKRIDVAQ